MKRKFTLLGIITGLIVILFGILVMAGAFGANTYSASSSSYYDSGYGRFGADFYTYVVNNAAETASAARTAANNLNHIAGFLRAVSGIMLMAFGLFMVCLFGCKLEKDFKLSSAIHFSAPAQEPMAPALSNTLPEENVAVPASPEVKEVAGERIPTANEWKCPKCGRINQNYVGTCGCGEVKPR